MKKRPGARPGRAVVTFELPASVAAATACVCGEFNDWSSTAQPLERTDDGRWEATVELAAGRAWRFRYLLDGEHWENDWAPDDYVPNDFGGHDSIVDLSALSASEPSAAIGNNGAGPAPKAARPAAKAAGKPAGKAVKKKTAASSSTTRTTSTTSTGKAAPAKASRAAKRSQ